MGSEREWPPREADWFSAEEERRGGQDSPSSHLPLSCIMRKESFGTHERIRRKKDFNRIHQYGSRRHSKNFVILFYKQSMKGSEPSISGEGHSGQGRRLGITVGKKVGNSVVRNRFKRLLREFFRRNKDKLPPAGDILVIVRKNASIRSYWDVRTELGDLLFESRE